MSQWYYKIKDRLVRKRKPCKAGDQVAIKGRKGTYNVYAVHVNYFIVFDNGTFERIEWSKLSKRKVICKG